MNNQRVSGICQIADQQIRQASAAAHQLEALAEVQSKNFGHEMNYFKSELSEALGLLKSEPFAKIQADTRSQDLAAELHMLNQRIRKEAPAEPTQLPTGSLGPLEYQMDTPPGLVPQKPRLGFWKEVNLVTMMMMMMMMTTTIMKSARKRRSPRRRRKRRRRETPLTPLHPPFREMSSRHSSRK